MKSLLCVFAVLFAATCVHAATISVPGDYPTISEAVTNAGDGDTVLVAPGVYTENINVTKAIVLLSAGGAAVTTIDGTGLDSGVLVDFNADIEVRPVLDGFTLTGSIGEAAVQTDGSSPIIQNCIVRNNANAGIWGDSTNTSVRSCEIFGNGSAGIWFFGGNFTGYGNCEVLDCYVANNGALTRGRDNEVNNGGGIWFQSVVTGVIRRCVVAYNTAHQHGGGIMITSQAAAVVENCTLVGNHAEIGTGDQLCLWNSTASTVVNCIFYGRLEALSPAVSIVGSTTIDITYCDFWNIPLGGATNFLIPSPVGILNVDPMFDPASPDGFGLLAASDLIDAGNPMTPVPAGGGARVDIGAHEFTGCLHGDVNLDGKINISDAVGMIGFIFDIYPQPIDPICASVNGDCIVSIADVVYLVNFIFAGGPAPVANDCK